MSWSIGFIGRPQNIVDAIEAHSETLDGYCKEEFDDAKSALIVLVHENRTDPETGCYQPVLKLTASGSGSKDKSGKVTYRSCSVSIEPTSTKLV